MHSDDLSFGAALPDAEGTSSTSASDTVVALEVSASQSNASSRSSRARHMLNLCSSGAPIARGASSSQTSASDMSTDGAKGPLPEQTEPQSLQRPSPGSDRDSADGETANLSDGAPCESARALSLNSELRRGRREGHVFGKGAPAISSVSVDGEPAAGSGSGGQAGVRAADVSCSAGGGSSRAAADADEEERRKARMLRNRESAHQSRQRKKMLVEEMEQRCHTLQAQNVHLSGAFHGFCSRQWHHDDCRLLCMRSG